MVGIGTTLLRVATQPCSSEVEPDLTLAKVDRTLRGALSSDAIDYSVICITSAEARLRHPAPQEMRRNLPAAR